MELLQPEVQLALDQKTIEIVRQSMVGFVKLDRDNPDFPSTSLGTGTLINVEGIRGIITAAHVAHAIEREREVGFLRLHSSPQSESMTVPSHSIDVISFGGEAEGEAGPDIAFLRLPLTLEQALSATNVFFSPNAFVAARRERTQVAKFWTETRFVAGVLAEATRTLAPKGNNYRVEFSAFRAYGEFENRRESDDGFDTFEFAFNYASDVTPPNSYGGLSGGGVWQTFDEDAPLHRQLTGVPFRESQADSAGQRRLICHGPRSIYFKLLPEVLRRWNPEAYAAWEATPD